MTDAGSEHPAGDSAHGDNLRAQAEAELSEARRIREEAQRVLDRQREALDAMLAQIKDRNEADLERQTVPEYPVSRDSQDVYLTREKAFRAWAGRRPQLLRIEEHVAEALKKVYDEHVEKIQEGSQRKWKGQELLADLTLEARVTAAKGALKRTGTLQAIMDEMDLSEIESIQMGNRGLWSPERGYPRVTLSFGEDDSLIRPRSVRVRVSGADRQWVGGLYDLLVGEVRKGVPWWSIFRAPWAAPLVGVLLGVAAFGWAFAVASDAERHSVSTIVNSGTVCLVGGLWAGVLVVRPLLRRAFPALEVVDTGETPRGRQVLGAIVGVLSFGLAVAGVVLGALAL